MMRIYVGKKVLVAGILGLFFFLPYSNAFADIVFDANTTSTANAVVTTTFNHTIGAAANFLLLGIATEYGGLVTDVASATFNGVALTKAVDENGSIASEIWYLANPATGTNSVVVQWTNANGSSRIIEAVSLAGGNASVPVNATTAAGYVRGQNLIASSTNL